MMNMNPTGAPQMPPQMAPPPPPPPPQPVDPVQLDQARQTLMKPTWDDVIALFRDDRLRTFRIDIETDSTIAADEQGEKQAVTEFMGVVSQVLTQLAPMATTMPELMPLATELLKYAARRFKAGRQLEIVIDDFADQMLKKAANPPAQQPDPKVQAAQMLAQAKIQQGQDQIQIEREKSQANVQLKQQEAAATMQLRAAQAQADAELEQSKAHTDAQIAAIKAMTPTHGMPR